MKEIQIDGNTYKITPVTLAQVIALQSAAAVLLRLSAAPQDLRQLTPDELRALSAALASILKTPPEAVLDWPLAQTLSAAVIASQAFLEVNGPYLQRDVVPAIERLTAFSASVTAALSKAQ